MKLLEQSLSFVIPVDSCYVSFRSYHPLPVTRVILCYQKPRIGGIFLLTLSVQCCVCYLWIIEKTATSSALLLFKPGTENTNSIH